jgi:hypothetical protein
MAVARIRRRYIVAAAVIVVIGLLIWQFALRSGPRPETEPYNETFDAVGTWTAGEGATSAGVVADGVYEMSVDLSGDIVWATAGRVFADGVYEVEATPLEGAVDHGYGMLFRVDNEDGRFYMFKVSSDGYVFAGLCDNSCAEVQVLADLDWIGSPAVNQGLEATNRLRVDASGAELIFYVNDTEVGRVEDNTLGKGDVGLMAETFTPEGLTIAFDNFSVTPLGDR